MGLYDAVFNSLLTTLKRNIHPNFYLSFLLIHILPHGRGWKGESVPTGCGVIILIYQMCWTLQGSFSKGTRLFLLFHGDLDKKLSAEASGPLDCPFFPKAGSYKPSQDCGSCRTKPLKGTQFRLILLRRKETAEDSFYFLQLLLTSTHLALRG